LANKLYNLLANKFVSGAPDRRRPQLSVNGDQTYLLRSRNIFSGFTLVFLLPVAKKEHLMAKETFL
jgi:hypothetical protein